MLKLILIILMINNLCNCGNLPDSQLNEQSLIISLLNGYNKNIRPDNQVSVDITASIRQIISIDEKQQIMISSLFIYQTWYDDRLSWTLNDSNYNIRVIHLPVKSLWIPDTMILNSADTNPHLTVNDYSLWSQGSNRIIYTENDSLAIDTEEYNEHVLWKLEKTNILITETLDRPPFQITNSIIFNAKTFIFYVKWNICMFYIKLCNIIIICITFFITN